MANVVSILGTVGGPNIHRVPIAWLGTAFYYAFICFVIFATAAALFDSDRKPAAKCGCMAMAFFFAGTIILAIYVGRNRENTSDEVVRDSIIFIVLGTIASLVGNVLFHAFDKSPPKPYSSRLPNSSHGDSDYSSSSTDDVFESDDNDDDDSDESDEAIECPHCHRRVHRIIYCDNEECRGEYCSDCADIGVPIPIRCCPFCGRAARLDQ